MPRRAYKFHNSNNFERSQAILVSVQRNPQIPETPVRKGPTFPTHVPPAASSPALLPIVTPPAALTPASALLPHKKNQANDVLRNLQAEYQDLLGKEAKNAGTVHHQLQWKLSQLLTTSKDLPHLQQRYDNLLLKCHQRLILQMMDAKGLVLHVINLPFDEVNKFDGSNAVIADTNIKKEKKVRQL
jgi:hypothetical protein